MTVDTQTLKPLAAAVGLALATMLSPGHAAPAVAHWTLTDLGTLGGTASFGYGINATGQVTGESQIAGDVAGRAFLYSNGTMTDLGTLGGPSSSSYGINAAGQMAGFAQTFVASTRRAASYRDGAIIDLGTLGGGSAVGYGINADGQVTGHADTPGNAAQRAFLYRNGTMRDLGTLGGTNSVGRGINASGQVTGHSNTPGDTTRAFLYSNGAMTDLGTLGGTSSFGYAINDAGQVTGTASAAGDGSRAFLYSNGTMTDLGSLGGSFSTGFGINSAGQVTGESLTLGNAAFRAFLYSNGTMTNLNTLNGVAGSGVTLTVGRAINDAGQIVANSSLRGYLLTLDTTVWQGAPSASWDDHANWSHGIAPNRNTQVFLEPPGSRTIVGPSTAVKAQTLTVGGNPADGGAIATLRLGGGRIALTTTANVGLTVTANGVLTGQGSMAAEGAGAFEAYNHGRIVADDVSLEGMVLYNHGTIEGNGRLAANTGVFNYRSIRVARPGERLRIEGLLSNDASIEATRGEIELTGPLFNNAGQIRLADGTLRTGSLQNQARVDISSGINEIYGVVDNLAAGRITVSGQGQVTFWDAVQNYGELKVASGAVATFFGDFHARNGGVLSGTGSKYYEAGYSVGDSPGVARDEGYVTFGADAVVQMEIGGLGAGSGDGFHDQMVVGRELSFGGTLTLVSWAGFTGQAGQSFDLFDWGSVSGQFDRIDTSGLRLVAGTRLDTSRLYVDGSISVTAVPEPGTALLMLLGLAGAGGAAARRGRTHGARQRHGTRDLQPNAGLDRTSP